ncbi:MAG: hypothetical protein DRG11_05565 [Epsilonproteobacteria bacterium]|nr:MAG: hypothetical protein DRG11_05565 [Campylobacterota bacterium]
MKRITNDILTSSNTNKYTKMIATGVSSLVVGLTLVSCGSSSGDGSSSGGGTSGITTTMCGATQTYLEVASPNTGEVWLDRNLGASQVGTSSTDHLSYGSLFQWGRKSDGHECITWTDGTTGTSVNPTVGIPADIPADNKFIEPLMEADWRVTPDDNLWDGATAINNPCPSGFRLPTDNEIMAEAETWNDKADAFYSVLKLPVPGSRSLTVNFAGETGYYWTSTVVDFGISFLLNIQKRGVIDDDSPKVSGYSVRCIKD